MNRRNFIEKIGITGAFMATGSLPLAAFADAGVEHLTILHTNDVHSRIEPFPIGDRRNGGKGGVAKRAALIKKIRAKESNVLLLDSGDIFQGTPYFNFFGGELEFKLMSEMKYDVATLGNHDFDAGMEGLKKQLPNASFDFVNCNYNLKDTILHDSILPYKIIQKGAVKIGILGVGIELNGLVPKKLYGNTQYMNPIEHANQTATKLKKDLSCDYVICLSHLGYEYKSDKVSDHDLAKQSKHIDLILGGHTHTLLPEPKVLLNAANEKVVINQVGWAGIVLGRLDIYFKLDRKGKIKSSQNLFI